MICTIECICNSREGTEEVPSSLLDAVVVQAMLEQPAMAGRERGGVGVEVAGGASRRFSAALSIGLGLGVGNSGVGEPRTLCPWSLPPLYSTARQGPTSLAWAGRPRSGRGSRAQ
jgi:hypothetical protein